MPRCQHGLQQRDQAAQSTGGHTGAFGDHDRGALRREHPRWDLQVEFIHATHRDPSAAQCVDTTRTVNDLELTPGVWVKRVVDDDRRRTVATWPICFKSFACAYSACSLAQASSTMRAPKRYRSSKSKCRAARTSLLVGAGGHLPHLQRGVLGQRTECSRSNGSTGINSTSRPSSMARGAW